LASDRCKPKGASAFLGDGLEVVVRGMHGRPHLVNLDREANEWIGLDAQAELVWDHCVARARVDTVKKTGVVARVPLLLGERLRPRGVAVPTAR